MSAPNTFNRQSRLIGTNAFQPVLKIGQRLRTPCFAVYYLANNKEGARLGIAVSKRNFPRAVDRNRLKRTVRESFRLHRQTLGTVDVVVVIHAQALNTESSAIHRMLVDVWKRVRDASNPCPATA